MVRPCRPVGLQSIRDKAGQSKPNRDKAGQDRGSVCNPVILTDYIFFLYSPTLAPKVSSKQFLSISLYGSSLELKKQNRRGQKPEGRIRGVFCKTAYFWFCLARHRKHGAFRCVRRRLQDYFCGAPLRRIRGARGERRWCAQSATSRDSAAILAACQTLTRDGRAELTGAAPVSAPDRGELAAYRGELAAR